MSSNARIFLISDTHFGHEGIYHFTTFSGVTRIRKEFLNASEGDAAMVERWNATVTPQDHVYHLGDVGWAPHVPELVKALNGHKRLILGNHDRADVREYRAMGFQKVMGCHQFRRGLWFTHIPMHENGLLADGLSIHGHIHEREPYGPRYRNVSVECIHYTPQLLEAVIADSI